MILKFQRNKQGLWYIDLPEYIKGGGHKEDLQMVLGADTLLDELSEFTDKNYNNVDVEINNIASLASFHTKEHAHIGLRKVEQSETGGCYYTVDFNKFCPKPIKTKIMWLCPVTLFVFNGEYPNFIGVKFLKSY